MTSILKADEIQDSSGNNIINENADTITIGAAGDTVTVPGTEVKSNKLSPASGTALHIGDSGDTITIPSGATLSNLGTASGFGGVTEIDQWRLTTSFDGSASPIASNLERVDTAPQAKLGTGMSESSGIFTFPSTGHWFVKYNINYFGNGDGDIRQAGGTIETTLNDSSYTQLAEGFNGCNNHGANYSMCTEINTILDITDTTNQKIRFTAYTTTSGATCSGDSANNRTFMTFFKLADT